MVPIGPTTVSLGKPADEPTFGWDNEYGSLIRTVSAFEIGRNLITNGEYLQFVEEGGYESEQYWSAPGWLWRTATASSNPKFWIPQDNRFRYRALFVDLELPEHWPVEVNHFEAEAYCRWKGEQYRLPSEAEYRVLTDLSAQPATDHDVPGWNSAYNNHLRFGSPTPVGLSLPGDLVNDLRGNVWQLLADDFHPFNGFHTDPLYADFSTPYFDADHGMMAGGSWATTGTAASVYYRLWFRRFFFQHAGFRLARSLDSDGRTSNRKSNCHTNPPQGTHA